MGLFSKEVKYHSEEAIAERYGVSLEVVKKARRDSAAMAKMTDKEFRKHVKALREVAAAGIFDEFGQPTLALKVRKAKEGLRLCKLNKNRSKYFIYIPK